MKKMIFITLLFIVMISVPAMALDTRDRLKPMDIGQPGLSNDGDNPCPGCSSWAETSCQKDYGTCLETCREVCQDPDFSSCQRAGAPKPIPGCVKGKEGMAK